MVKFDLGFESKTVVALTLSSLWNFFFIFLSLLDRAEPLLRTLGWDTFFVTRYMHRSLSAVLLGETSFHIPGISCWTLTHCTLSSTSSISLSHSCTCIPELIIVNNDFENLHSVYRSLEIHNCALISSPSRSPSPSPHPSPPPLPSSSPLPPPPLPPLPPPSPPPHPLPASSSTLSQVFLKVVPVMHPVHRTQYTVHNQQR